MNTIPLDAIRLIYSKTFWKVSYLDDAGHWNDISIYFEEQKIRDINISPAQAVGASTTSVSGQRKKLNWRWEYTLTFSWDNFMLFDDVSLREGLALDYNQVTLTKVNNFLQAAAQGRETRFYYNPDNSDYIAGVATFDNYNLVPIQGTKLFGVKNLKFSIWKP